MKPYNSKLYPKNETDRILQNGQDINLNETRINGSVCFFAEDIGKIRRTEVIYGVKK